MLDDPLRRVYATLAHQDGDRFARLRAICHLCIEALGVDGAGVMLMAHRTHQGTLYATDDNIMALEELQNVAGEGPCIDAYTRGQPVLEPDVAGHGVAVWPVFAPEAVEADMLALFSFPLMLDDTCVGALNLYRRESRHLNASAIDDGRLLAAMVARDVLGLQADAEPGTLPTDIADLSGDRVSIEQATGMVAAQLGISIVEAADRLRQLARREDRHLTAVARDIIARRITLDAAAHD